MATRSSGFNGPITAQVTNMQVTNIDVSNLWPLDLVEISHTWSRRLVNVA
jgi:hypothetical protein